MPKINRTEVARRAGITLERLDELAPTLREYVSNGAYRKAVIEAIRRIEGGEVPAPPVERLSARGQFDVPHLVPETRPRVGAKRIVAIGDMHCGHVAGLTPPAYQLRENERDPGQTKLARSQAEAWAWYVAKAKEIGRIDALIVNGDLIDGDGHKSGGTELLTTDRRVQAQIAHECLLVWDTSTYLITKGTPYHAGNCEEFEVLVAKDLGCRIGSHEWPVVNGVTLDVKHHTGSSSIPHGRSTGISKEHLWNLMWSREEAQPEAQIILRSHVHYHALAGGSEAGRQWVAMTLPALQTARTRFGALRCSGVVHFGLVVLEINGPDDWYWKCHSVKLEHDRAQAFSLC